MVNVGKYANLNDIMATFKWQEINHNELSQPCRSSKQENRSGRLGMDGACYLIIPSSRFLFHKHLMLSESMVGESFILELYCFHQSFHQQFHHNYQST